MRYQEYNTEIETAAREQRPSLLWNDDRGNNAIIMKEIFKYSTNISMYCGEGSIFNTNFEDRVNNSVEEGDYNPISDLHTQINQFLNKENTKLTIILQHTETIENISDSIMEMWEQKLNNKGIILYRLNPALSPQFHFTIGDDKMYRREIGAEEHSAFASFNDPDHVAILKEQFNYLIESSQEIIYDNAVR